MKKLFIWPALMLFLSCSTGDDVDTNPAYDVNGNNSSQPIGKGLSGYFTGVWRLNGVETVGDDIIELIYQKAVQKHHVEVSRYTTPTYVGFNADSQYLSMYEFPFMSLVRQVFPDLDVAYLTIANQYGAPFDEEETLWHTVLEEERENGSKDDIRFYDIPFNMVGYSATWNYYELKSNKGVAFILLVVTAMDGSYFAMLLNFLPGKCVVSTDAESRVLTFALHIHQIETVDKDMRKTVVPLSQDIKLTFTSTHYQKTIPGGD